MTPIEHRTIYQNDIMDWQASSLSGIAYCKRFRSFRVRTTCPRKKIGESVQIAEQALKLKTLMAVFNQLQPFPRIDACIAREPRNTIRENTFRSSLINALHRGKSTIWANGPVESAFLR